MTKHLLQGLNAPRLDLFTTVNVPISQCCLFNEQNLVQWHRSEDGGVLGTIGPFPKV